MARVRIREAHGGGTREIDDRALPYFPGWVILDTLDDSTDASPLYLSKAESDFRYLKSADLTDPASAAGAAFRAAYSTRRTVADLPSGVVMWHRGGPNVAPEDTIEGFRLAVASGAQIINANAFSLSDGGLALIHDTTVDRTTTGTGAIGTFSTDQWRALSHDTAAWWGPGFGTLGPKTLGDYFGVFGSSVVHAIEAMTSAEIPPLVALIVKHGLTKSSIVASSAGLGPLATVVNAGIEAWLIDGPGITTAAALNANGVKGICLRADQVTAAQVNAYRAAGIKVEIHTVTRQADKVKFTGCDVSYWASDDPIYFEGDTSKYRRASDPFALRSFYHGMIPSAGNTTFGAGSAGVDFAGSGDLVSSALTRGYFVADRWGTSAAVSWVLQGWAAPLAKATGTYRQRLRVYFDALGTDSSRWAGAFICCPTDESYTNTAPAAANNGYLVLARINGTVELSKITAGVQSGLVTVATAAVGTAAAATVGATPSMDLQVDVTPTAITVTRTDVTGSNTVTINDATFRGGYFHLGASNISNSRSSWKVDIT